MAASFTPPTLLNSPAAQVQSRVVRLVRTENEIRRAITIAKTSPQVISEIKLACDIHCQNKLVFDTGGVADLRGIILSGAGQFTLYFDGDISVDRFIDIQAPIVIRDLTINATNATSIVGITGDIKTTIEGVTFEATNDGYVFDLSGTHQNTLIRNISAHGDATVSGLIVANSVSTHWGLSGAALYGFGNLVHGVFRFVYINDVSVDSSSVPHGGSLVSPVDRSVITSLSNFSTVNTSGGTENFISNLASDVSSTLTTTVNDTILGVSATYTASLGNKATFISNTAPSSRANVPAIFSQGLAIGVPAANAGAYEEILGGTTATSDGTIKAAFSYTTISNTGYFFEFDVVARQTNGANQTNVYKLGVRVKNNGGTLTSGPTTTIYSDEEVAAWDATTDTSGTAVRVRVTGAAATDITWNVIARVRRV